MIKSVLKVVFIAFFLLALIAGAFIVFGFSKPLEEVFLENRIFTEQELVRLNGAQLVNHEELIEGLFLNTDDASVGDFEVANPYKPVITLKDEQCKNSVNCSYSKEVLGKTGNNFPARRHVYEWWSNKKTSQEIAQVCGIKFLDANQYRLDTFENIQALRAESGYSLTHYHACGACSTLQDLGVYGTKDLTLMAKHCSKKISLEESKTCMEEIGFTEACAAVWAYNAENTRTFCPRECIKAYGLIPLLLGKENAAPVNESGELNPCLMCDEMMSGPGFQYGSGRTRRNSGIESEIYRPEEQVYEVLHDYF